MEAAEEIYEGRPRRRWLPAGEWGSVTAEEDGVWEKIQLDGKVGREMVIIPRRLRVDTTDIAKIF